MANKHMYDNERNQEIKKAQLDTIIKDTKENSAQIRSHLGYMKNDLNDSLKKYSKEPETHVKKTVHKTFTFKFHQLL